MIKEVHRNGHVHDGLCPACKAEGVTTELVNIHRSPYAACPRVLGHAKLVKRFSVREKRLMELWRLPRATKTSQRHGRKTVFKLSDSDGQWILGVGGREDESRIAASEMKRGLVARAFMRLPDED